MKYWELKSKDNQQLVDQALEESQCVLRTVNIMLLGGNIHKASTAMSVRVLAEEMLKTIITYMRNDSNEYFEFMKEEEEKLNEQINDHR